MLLLALALSPSAYANSNGYVGQSLIGCTTCHGTRGESTTSAQFGASTPTTVTPGSTTTLTFTVRTTAVTRHAAGLNVSATGGTFSAGSTTQVTSGEITQLAPVSLTSGGATFSFDWTAPTTEGTVTLYGVGIAVNSDLTSTGDGWRLANAIEIRVDDGCNDNDRDGYQSCTTGVSDDCNDTNATVHPGAAETCDGVDQDCDGLVDNHPTTAPTWYADVDGDGYGNHASSTSSCARPSGYVSDSSDCDDRDPLDGPPVSWWYDQDADTYGDPTIAVSSCLQPLGYTDDNTDCDDDDGDVFPGAYEACDVPLDSNCDGSLTYTDADHDGYAACIECDDGRGATHPGATETCDGLDDDCDGAVDEAGASGEYTWFADADGDGYGDLASSIDSCVAPSGYVADSTDCDDGSATIHPGGVEVCDGGGVDEDCDGVNGTEDPSVTGTTTYYADTDGDRYGDRSSTTRACELPAGYASNAADCDDTNVSVYPSAPELCDSLDNNCDGAVDNGTTGTNTWYADRDLDGYGDATTTLVICTAPPGWSLDGTDCNDGNADSWPGNPEIWYDGVDQDCDGKDDDRDSDGYGHATDCNDDDAAIHPGLTDTCNGLDDDCDGRYDEDAAVTHDYYPDTDHDGHGISTGSIKSCLTPYGYSSLTDDCNDAEPTAYPGATEVWYNGIDENCDGKDDDQDADGYGIATDCNDLSPRVHPGMSDTCDGTDTDCDGTTDEDGSAFKYYYRDADNDSYGSNTDVLGGCSAALGYITTNGDCDDSSALVHPGVIEIWYDGIDQNCDGNDTDQDGDGYATGTDCSDTDATRYPGAPEHCNGLDDDCDGTADEEASNATTFYTDADGDGYGDSATATRACTRPPNTTITSGDCDDTNTGVHPGQAEVWYDGVDQDCDGNDNDQDRDGYAFGVDCVDTDPAAHPGADEIWYDGVDEACDGGDDEDADGDGYASSAYSGDDCDDEVDTTYPGADDPWYDGVDANCDAWDDYDADLDGHASATYGGDDCDDGNPTVYPDAPPIADDGIDNNCGGDHPDDADDDGYFASVDDCDDANSAVHPGVEEVWYDGIDQDCDGNDLDQDLDGSDIPDDCDDLDPSISPLVDEIPYDGLDQNCDASDEYDADGDGYDSMSYGGDDCDDGSATTYPGAPDAPYDGIVTDCDSSDEFDADGDGYDYSSDCDDANSRVTTGSVYYADHDGDGYGDARSTVTACNIPTGYVTNDDDCNDTSNRTNPDASERWYDGLDSDCDGHSDYDQDFDGHDAQDYGGDDCDDQDFSVWDTCDSGGETGDSGADDTGPIDDTSADSGGETGEDTSTDSGEGTNGGDSGWVSVDDSGKTETTYRECACGTEGGSAGALAALWAGALALVRRKRRNGDAA